MHRPPILAAAASTRLSILFPLASKQTAPSALPVVSWPILLLLASLSALLAYEYFLRVEEHQFEARLAMHRAIVDGAASSQYRHRILAPYLADGMMKGLTLVLPGPQRLRPGDRGSTGAFNIAYLLFNSGAILFSLASLYALLNLWFSGSESLAGVLLAAATMPLTFQDQYFHPWSFLEFGFFALGFVLIERERHGWFAVVLALACLNRETSLFLLLAFFFTRILPWEPGRGVSRESLRLFTAYGVLWLGIFFGLRLVRGFPPPTFTAHEAWRVNVLNWRRATGLNLLFFGAFWIYVALGFRRAPAFLRRASLIIPLYAALLCVIGLWYEIRYLLTLYPILIPMGMSYLFRLKPAR